MKRKYQLAVLVLMVVAMVFSVGCSEEDLAALQGMVNTDDTTAPVAEMVSPVHGSTVSDDFILRINVMDAENYSTLTKVTLNDSVDVSLVRDGSTSSLFSSDVIALASLTAGARQSVVIISSNNNALIATNEYYFYTSANSTNTNVEDTTAPTVSIVSPATGSTVADTFAVSVNASDNETYVAYVEVSIDGTLFETITNRPSGSYITGNYNVPSWNDGNYSVSVVAYDAAGNHASDSISVSFTNAYVPSDLNFTLVDIADDFNPSDALTQSVAVNAPTFKWTDWAAGANEYAVSVWNSSETEVYYWVVYGDISSIQYGDKNGASIDWITNSAATLNDGSYIVNVIGLNASSDVAIAHLKASVITGVSKSAGSSKAMPFITKEQYNKMLLDYKNK